MVAQQLHQAFAAAGAFGHHQHAGFGLAQVLLQLAQRVLAAALDAQVGQWTSPFGGLGAADGQHRVGVGQREELV